MYRYEKSLVKPMGFCIAFGMAAGQINASAVRRAALATFILAQAVSVGMRHIAWAGECDATKSEVGQPQIWRFIESILCKPL